MAYENYTVKQYMDAQYKQDYSIISFEELKIVNIEYIDTAELYEKDDFERQTKIEFYSHRVNNITIHIRLQREFLNEFGICYLPTLEKFKEFGHSVSWKDKDNFLKMMRKIELSEKVYISKMEEEIKLLQDLRSKKKKGQEVPLKQSRGNFIKNIAILNKEGYKIVYTETTMEDLAYIIKLQFEAIKNKT